VLPKASEIPGRRGFADQNQTITKKTKKTGWQCLGESDISVVADPVNFTGEFHFVISSSNRNVAFNWKIPVPTGFKQQC
jgi:hypothetical protein